MIHEYFQARNHDKTYHAIPPDLLYFSAAEFEKNLQKTISIQFNKFDILGQSDLAEEKQSLARQAQNNIRVLDLEIKPVPDFALAGRANQKDPFELVKDFVSNTKTIIACLTESFRDRIAKILPDYNL